MVGIPDGEWWGVARDFAVVLQMEQVAGWAAVATREGDIVFHVTITYPEIQVDPTLSVPNIDEPIYVLENDRYVSSWHVTLPEAPSASAVGTDEDILRQMTVGPIYGSFGADQPAFELFRTEVSDPRRRCDGSTLAILERLRGAVSEERHAADGER